MTIEPLPKRPPETAPPTRSSTECLRAILGTIPDAAFIHRTDGRILETNVAAKAQLGYPYEELVGQCMPDLEPRPMTRVPLPSAHSLPTKGHHVRKDGSTFPVEIHSQWLCLQDDTVVISIARDMTRERKAEQTLRSEQEFRRHALRLSAGLLDSEMELGSATSQALQQISDQLDVDVVSLTRLSGHGDVVEPLHTWACDQQIVDLLHRIAPLGHAPNLANALLESGSFQVHAGEWPENWPEERVTREAGIQSSVYVLLESRHDSLVFVAADTIGRRAEWSAQMVGQLRLAGKLLLDAIERRTANAALTEALDGTILAFARTTEARDPYTAGHQERVTKLALAIGRRLGVATDELDALRVAAMLHDVGKLSIPAEYLSKPGQLTEMERRLVETHSQVGHEILGAAALPWSIADIIHQHHERLDGSGYPRGLLKDEVLPEARILAVSDVVEAMCSHRPYRPSLGPEAAAEEILRGKGLQYDPDVADALLAEFNAGFSW